MKKRVFLIVMDSVGIGELPDANKFGDVGSHTLKACTKSDKLSIPNLSKLGIFNIDEINCGQPVNNPIASFAKIGEQSMGKDTTIGHWEISGIISKEPFPTYPNGFPKEIIEKFEKLTGHKVICNKPYSGTKVIEDYGKQHMETGNLIIYTSADSVFQIAAHEDIIPVKELYNYCQIARDMLKGEHAVGRVIARPFVGEVKNFERTANRHDFSLTPPRDTMCDYIKDAGMQSIGVGKISDIFAGKGLTKSLGTNKDNKDGMDKTIKTLQDDFEGLCFVNLVDFDMKFGHRNDVDGYANALTEFDVQLGQFIKGLRKDDILIVTADHGCDPSTPSTDHSREYIPMLIFGENIKKGVNLGIRTTFSDIAATVLDYLNVDGNVDGKSFLKNVIN